MASQRPLPFLEALREQLDQECQNITTDEWQKPIPSMIPWALFSSLSNSGRSIPQLVIDGKFFLSYFKNKWAENIDKKHVPSETSTTERKTMKVQFVSDTTPDYPLEYLSMNCQLCILFNSIGKSELVREIPGLRKSIPLSGKDLVIIIPEDSVRKEFLNLQQQFLCEIQPHDMITLMPSFGFPPLQVTKSLGSGAFSVVNEVFDVNTGKTFARKLLKKRVDSKDKQQLRKCIREVLHLEELVGDRHVVQLAGSYVWNNEIGILLEPVAEHDLKDYIQKFLSNSPLERQPMEATLLHTFGCLSLTLCRIGQDRLLRHKDIKPENILVHKNDFMFTDFGSAVAILEGRTMSTGTNVGGVTDMYCAPEVLRAEQRDMTTDVFSLGCVYLEIIAAIILPEEDIRKRFPTPYGQDLSKVKSFLAYMKQSSDPKLELPLLWCSQMLEEKENRLTINALVKEIFKTCPTADFPKFFCEHCFKDLLLRALKMVPTSQGDAVTSVVAEAAIQPKSPETSRGTGIVLRPAPAAEKSDVQLEDEYSMLHQAVQADKELSVQELIEVGADIDMQNRDGDTALHLAAQAGNELLLRELVNAGALADLQNQDGDTALHLAAQAGEELLVQVLVGAGADINVKNQDGNTALHLAVQVGKESPVLELIRAKADIDLQNREGNAALHLAARAKNASLTKELINAQGDVFSLNGEDETVVDILKKII